jgi:hypothetical protein
MFGKRRNRFSVSCRWYVPPQLGDPAVEQRSCLLDEALVQDRTKISESVHLWHEGTESCALPYGAYQILLP